jgi:hypothetical protein
MRAPCPTHLFILDCASLVIFSKAYKGRGYVTEFYFDSGTWFHRLLLMLYLDWLVMCKYKFWQQCHFTLTFRMSFCRVIGAMIINFKQSIVIRMSGCYMLCIRTRLQITSTGQLKRSGNSLIL